MRKALAAILVLGLLAGALSAPAVAKKKKKKPPEPVATTLFMEGTSNFGEEDQIGNGTYLTLVAEEGSGEKSQGIPNYVGGPNTNCAGNSLFPVFVGTVSGQVVGDMKVTFNAISQGGKVEVRIWPDINAQACNDAYIPPAASVVVDLPAGEGTVEATIPGVDFEASSLMMIQLTAVIGAPPYYARAFYGTADSKVEFSCIPPAGATSCTG
ncbi:MAG: hypothetical protein ACRD1T_22185 [Acidimicrobiia bacterium]